MENETVSKSRGRRTSVQQETAQTNVSAVTDVIEDKKRPMIPKDIDPNQIVTVRNGFQGRLVYKSKRTGERFVWDSFGA